METAMSRVEDAVIQDEIANSLLGDVAEPEVEEQPEQVDPSEQTLEDQLVDSLVSQPDQTEESEQEQFEAPESDEAEQPIEITPEAIANSIEQTDAFIREQ